MKLLVAASELVARISTPAALTVKKLSIKFLGCRISKSIPINVAYSRHGCPRCPAFTKAICSRQVVHKRHLNYAKPTIKSSSRPSKEAIADHIKVSSCIIITQSTPTNWQISTITRRSIFWISEAIRFCCYTEKKVPCPLHMPNPISLIGHIDHPVNSKEGLVVTSFVKKQVRFLYSAAATARAVSNYISDPFPKSRFSAVDRRETYCRCSTCCAQQPS